MDFDSIPDSYDEGFAQPEPLLPDPEPEDALSAFNRQWNAKLEQKRAAEAESERAVRAHAAEELAAWKTQREVRLNSKKDKNRSEEQVLLETIESEADGANIWERVSKLIDASAEPEAGQADVTRMRKLFIQLKNEPLEKTRGAAIGAN